MNTDQTPKKKIIIQNFNKFNATEKTVEFAQKHLNAYIHDAWNVYCYDVELENFLKGNEIDYVVKDRIPFE